MPPPAETSRPPEGVALARLLSGLAAATGAIDARRVALVVAHPDDETLAIGGQLPRLDGITIVHVTDGAPPDLRDAQAKGFATAEDYAAARRGELARAMALAGIDDTQRVSLDVPDQGAARAMVAIADRLASLFTERRIEAVLTHAYEGGHPDHDAVAFAVRKAARRTWAAVVEMPFYRAGPEGWVRQAFAAPPAGEAPTEIVRPLSPDELAAKRAMLATFESQRDVLEGFTDTAERFRPAPAVDFTVLPNGGHLLYESFGWAFTGDHWRAAVLEASTCPD